MNDLMWVLARSSGLTAVVLLSAVVAFGLLLSMRAASPRWPRGLSTEAHAHLTTLALAVTGLHLTTLLLDSQAGISLVDLVVPFVSGWAPFAVGLGVIALWIAIFTWVSTSLRARLGRRRWAMLHRLAIVSWAAGMLHGVLAGTDTGTPWAVFVYVGCGLGVALLFAARVLGVTAAPAPAPAPRASGGLPPLR